jgi:hypothetical protein
MEQNFKKQLVERQEYVETLLKEMKEKEKEFQEYCRQVEIDRKFFDLFLRRTTKYLKILKQKISL